MTEPLCVLTVHAHPDDEASKGAGTIAKYQAEGVRTVLVCCTGGEEGDILNPAMDRPEVVDNLQQVRREELDRAAAIIGYDVVHMLGYRDSGMPDSDATPDHEHEETNAIVERVVDGDTIVVAIIGNRERVRLLGIDTPESVAVNRPEQCYGKESAAYLTSLLPEGTEVTLVRDIESRDQYDRLLAYVVRSSDQLFINLDLLERGYAGVMIYEPNSFYRELFENAENDAFRAGIGLWGVCGGPDVPLG